MIVSFKFFPLIFSLFYFTPTFSSSNYFTTKCNSKEVEVKLPNGKVMKLTGDTVTLEFPLTDYGLRVLPLNSDENSFWNISNHVPLTNVIFEGRLSNSIHTYLTSYIKAKVHALKNARIYVERERIYSDHEYSYESIVLSPINKPRIGLLKEYEKAIYSLSLSCLQQIVYTKPSYKLPGDLINQTIPFRRKAYTKMQKLQDTVNTISDFIVSKLVYSITNLNSTLPDVNDSFIYTDITSKNVSFTATNGSFNQIPTVERLMDTKIEERDGKIGVEVLYYITDISLNLGFNMSDRSYPGTATIKLSGIVFQANISFAYQECSAVLEDLRILNKPNAKESIVTYGLLGYEYWFYHSYLVELVQKNVYKFLWNIINAKIRSYDCNKGKEILEHTLKLATDFIEGFKGAVNKSFAPSNKSEA